MPFEQLRPLNKFPRVLIFESPNAKNPLQKWWWKIWVSSDEVAASTEGYSTRENCISNLLKLEQHIKYLREQNLIK